MKSQKKKTRYDNYCRSSVIFILFSMVKICFLKHCKSKPSLGTIITILKLIKCRGSMSNFPKDAPVHGHAKPPEPRPTYRPKTELIAKRIKKRVKI